MARKLQEIIQAETLASGEPLAINGADLSEFLLQSSISAAENNLRDILLSLREGTAWRWELTAATLKDSLVTLLDDERSQVLAFCDNWIAVNAGIQGRALREIIGLPVEAPDLSAGNPMETLLQIQFDAARQAEQIDPVTIRKMVQLIAQLPLENQSVWGKRLCRAKLIRAKDLDAILTEEKKRISDRPRDYADDEDQPHERYHVVKGAHCFVESKDGKLSYHPLCDFTAKINLELILDNGQEVLTKFRIEGTRKDGSKLPTCDVLGKNFSGMSWVLENWGTRAIIRAGSSVKDKLREAIQMLSTDCVTKRIYTHTGWREIDGQRVFLHAGGAVGAENVSVQLEGRLARYRLPEKCTNAKESMRASIETMKAAKATAAWPLWGMMYLAPLTELIETDFTLFAYGQSGALKSSYVSKMLCHYGHFDYLSLPENWDTTQNALLKHCFLMKDTPLVIDDYAPQASGLDSSKQEAKAQTVLRAIGNRTQRNRLNADTTDKDGYPPRGVVIATGEYLPSGESIGARLLPIEFEIDDKRQPLTVKKIELAAMQNHAHDDLLASAMVGYLLWIGGQWETLKKEIPERITKLRDELAGGTHLRTPTMFAKVLLAIQLALTYARETKAINEKRAEQLFEHAKKTLAELAAKQAGHVQSERPSALYLNTLRDLFVQGRAYLLPLGQEPNGEHRGSDFLGWYDKGLLYILPVSRDVVAKHCLGAGISFSTKLPSLYKMLESEKLLDLSAVEKGRHTIRIETARVIPIKRTCDVWTEKKV